MAEQWEKRRDNKKTAVTGRTRTMVIMIDRFVLWLSRHWLGVFNGAAALYVGLPILAPILMNIGATGPAKAIYVAYSPMCHQMAFRSFFLFGEQSAYPRELAGTEMVPFESYTPELAEFQGIAATDSGRFFAAARAFLGNEQMGYKMALCERDIGIYLFVLLGGLVYAVLRRQRRIKPLPIMAFIILGMGPIGLDGFSQLFGYMFQGSETGLTAFIANILVLRESTPLLRSLTGAWFGLTLVWLAYPHVNEGMKETEMELQEKLSKARLL
ncbi:MAG: DUF2085 domain-containing protein [Chloroflexi bacterium]|nr:DUF2085 domain-containing protein [Chloroflexota bacterium]MBP8057361.1 DUF2085 domain-containing protein [Chloroflexota bacterium]